jgi:TerC family integral membrane protein
MSAKGDETMLGGNTTSVTSLFQPGAGPTVLLNGVEDADVYRRAIQRTLAWVAAAGAFGGILWATAGGETGEEFFAGYLVEQSLSVDNLFVFLLLFDYFEVPLQNQDRVLNWGIYGAIVMRAVMIGLGAAALENFHAILLVFAGILVYSSAKVLLGGGDGEEEEDLSENYIVKFSHRFIESTDKYDGDKFFTVVDGIRKATPLFICMIAVEISDVVFAVDSIPAVFGVTEVRTSSFRFSAFQMLPADTFYTVHSSESSHCLYLQHVCDYGPTEPLHDSFQSSD